MQWLHERREFIKRHHTIMIDVKLLDEALRVSRSTAKRTDRMAHLSCVDAAISI